MVIGVAVAVGKAVAAATGSDDAAGVGWRAAGAHAAKSSAAARTSRRVLTGTSIVRGRSSGSCFRAGAFRPARRLFRVLHGSGLADDGDLDLSRVLERALDLLCDVPRKARGLEVVELVGLHHDTDLAAGLDRERLLDAGEAVRDALELLQPLDVV